MRIVKPTYPPSMAIIVDTIMNGDIEIAISLSHALYNRIDTVMIKGNVIGVLRGFDRRDFNGPEFDARAASPLIEGARVLARIHVLRNITSITERNIEEVEQ